MVKTTPVSVKMGSVKVSVNGTDNWKTDPNHYCYYIILLLITLSDLAFYNFTIRLKASFYHNMDLWIIKKYKNLFLNCKISSHLYQNYWQRITKPQTFQIVLEQNVFDDAMNSNSTEYNFFSTPSLSSLETWNISVQAH